MMGRPNLDEYLNLIWEFITGTSTVSQFETKYLELFKSDETIRDEKIFLILDRLFSDIDVYDSDPTIRGPDGLDDEGLKKAAHSAYVKLKSEANIR